MISFSGAVFLVIGFIVLLRLFSLVEKTSDAISTAKLALADVRNSELSDDAKEIAMQRHAKRLFALFFLLTIGGAAALLLPAGLIWLFEQIGIISLVEVMTTALSWEFILTSTIATIAYLSITYKHRNYEL